MAAKDQGSWKELEALPGKKKTKTIKKRPTE